MRRLVILLSFACTSCTAGRPPPLPAGRDSGTLQQIRKLVGDAACSEDAQCHTLPVGARGCGGPEYYLAWSSAGTDGDALGALGKRYKAEREAQNAARGGVSDCRFAVDPGAVCSAGACRLRTFPAIR